MKILAIILLLLPALGYTGEFEYVYGAGYSKVSFEHGSDDSITILASEYKIGRLETTNVGAYGPEFNHLKIGVGVTNCNICSDTSYDIKLKLEW